MDSRKWCDSMWLQAVLQDFLSIPGFLDPSPPFSLELPEPSSLPSSSILPLTWTGYTQWLELHHTLTLAAHSHTCTQTHAYTHTMHTHMHIHTCTHVHTHTLTCTHTSHTHIHTHTHRTHRLLKRGKPEVSGAARMVNMLQSVPHDIKMEEEEEGREEGSGIC